MNNSFMMRSVDVATVHSYLRALCEQTQSLTGLRSLKCHPRTTVPLGALRVFEGLPRTCFSRPRRINVTPAAVSQQIKNENYIQVPLFRRSGRRVESPRKGWNRCRRCARA